MHCDAEYGQSISGDEDWKQKCRQRLRKAVRKARKRRADKGLHGRKQVSDKSSIHTLRCLVGKASTYELDPSVTMVILNYIHKSLGRRNL